MKILRLLRLYPGKWLADWAMKEIHPAHPDVPRIVLYRAHVNQQIEESWAALLTSSSSV